MAAEPVGSLIAAGRDANVFALGDDRILRRCRDPGYRCKRQAEMMEWARAQGFPVPRVFWVAGPEMVMERVDGRTMVTELLAGAIDAPTIGRQLAELLRTLHGLPVPAGTPTGHRIRHLDLHPENVLLSPHGPVVIDWSNADFGPAGVDTALSALILAQLAVLPGPFQDAVSPIIDALLTEADPFSQDDLAAAVAMRSSNPTMTDAEIGALGQAAELIRPAG
jgi:aminoglycoside phosphotransferase (APT) family kinase protein